MGPQHAAAASHERERKAPAGRDWHGLLHRVLSTTSQTVWLCQRDADGDRAHHALWMQLQQALVGDDSPPTRRHDVPDGLCVAAERRWAMATDGLVRRALRPPRFSHPLLAADRRYDPVVVCLRAVARAALHRVYDAVAPAVGSTVTMPRRLPWAALVDFANALESHCRGHRPPVQGVNCDDDGNVSPSPPIHHPSLSVWFGWLAFPVDELIVWLAAPDQLSLRRRVRWTAECASHLATARGRVSPCEADFIDGPLALLRVCDDAHDRWPPRHVRAWAAETPTPDPVVHGVENAPWVASYGGIRRSAYVRCRREVPRPRRSDLLAQLERTPYGRFSFELVPDDAGTPPANSAASHLLARAAPATAVAQPAPKRSVTRSKRVREVRARVEPDREATSATFAIDPVGRLVRDKAGTADRAERSRACPEDESETDAGPSSPDVYRPACRLPIFMQEGLCPPSLFASQQHGTPCAHEPDASDDLLQFLSIHMDP